MKLLTNGFTARRRGGRSSYVCLVAIGAAVLMVISMVHLSYLQISIDMTNYMPTEAAVTDKTKATIIHMDGAIDKEALKTRRETIQNTDSCSNADVSTVVSRIKSEMFTRVPTQTDHIKEHSPRLDVRKCKNVIIDFGANVGDTLNHVIDSGLPKCAGELHIDLHERAIKPQKWNRVTKFLEGMMKSTNHAPEDYCYYGIEGNPHFTKRLQGIEDYVHSINPKPVEHAAFFTESVGTGDVGMTKLFLDTVNTKENFWGSSIMEGHQDVKKSAKEGNMIEAPYHDVMGYTITELMDMTLKGLDNNAAEDEKKGGHLLLKVDIEGGEYALTQEVVSSKALCKFVSLGNTVDVIIEQHSQKVTGPNPLAGKFKTWKKELTECGVRWQNLAAYWA